MTLSPVATVRKFATSVARITRLIRKVEVSYIGCEVLEDTGRGYNVAVIVKMEWSSDVLNWQDGQDGDWLVTLRYLHDGSQITTSTEHLTLTGEQYQDIDSVRPIHPAYMSMWSN